MVQLIHKDNSFYIKKDRDIAIFYPQKELGLKTLDEILKAEWIEYNPSFEIKNYKVIHVEDNFIDMVDFIKNKLIYSDIDLIISRKTEVC